MLELHAEHDMMLANLANQFCNRKDLGNHRYFFRILSSMDIIAKDDFIDLFVGSGLIALVRYMDGLKTVDSDFELILDFLINVCKSSMIFKLYNYRKSKGCFS